MALIYCPECQKRMSDKAESCPVCGCPNEGKDTRTFEDVKEELETLLGYSHKLFLTAVEIFGEDKIIALHAVNRAYEYFCQAKHFYDANMQIIKNAWWEKEAYHSLFKADSCIFMFYDQFIKDLTYGKKTEHLKMVFSNLIKSYLSVRIRTEEEQLNPLLESFN